MTDVNMQQVKVQWIWHWHFLILMLNNLRQLDETVNHGGQALAGLHPHSAGTWLPVHS